MLEWNDLDPVDDYEIHRNNLIYNNVNKNRNPYVDHPEWAEIVYDVDYFGSGAINDAPYAPSSNDENNSEITYTTQNILSSSNAGDALIGECVSNTTIVGNQISAMVLASNNFGGMFVNGYYKLNAVIRENKIALKGTDTAINNYYTNEKDSLVFILDSNERLLSHIAVETGSTIDQTIIDDWDIPSAPVGYTNNVWYDGNTEFTSLSTINKTTILRLKLTYDTNNSFYQVAAYGDTAILSLSDGTSGSEVDVQFDK